MPGLQTPVLLLIFNRPEQTLRVFNEIRKIRPEFLYIAADGPRANREDDKINCVETRKIISKIDWDCEIKTLFRENNLGCKIAVSSAIDWFFAHVDEGIILEDDCLPDLSFFSFCSELLEKYRNNEAIMHIGGNNFQDGIRRCKASYYFSNYAHIWGWATWRRAWKKYSVEMKGIEDFISSRQLKKIFKNKFHEKFYLNKILDTKRNKIDTWDYQWSYAIWKHHGMAIIPNVNLVSNIGFGIDATHTSENKSVYSLLNVNQIGELTHPASIIICKTADDYFATKQTGFSNIFSYYLFQYKRKTIEILFSLYKSIKNN